MKKKDYQSLPLVYSCSGCSNIAQLANRIAVELDHDAVAEMSCIAGVGGGVPSLVKKAKSGRQIVALDGCHLHCVQHCLGQHGVEATHHFTLTDYGFRKEYHKDFSDTDVLDLREKILRAIASSSQA